MTRNEYIKSFNSVIDDKAIPMFGQNSVLSIINQWLNSVDASIVSSTKFIHEIRKISSRVDKDVIKKLLKSLVFFHIWLIGIFLVILGKKLNEPKM